ncbi:Transcriptional regulator, GntR family / Aspartate aminotransferase [Arthrobacter sp. 9AX]|uniref:MocR-like transcription factor YczR n=1 Tax=Arthrobacter sp. 9AX TaxID=2653131 RepID=UPI0012F1B8FB|nr:PLP-dependent aminotransferase family protein [Arthrobacter sp. 9AX]VXC37724.1 Transcriptional regulator, GntR family / Aspartate aminotransferase [Arthrobacter sp. 9AX]
MTSLAAAALARLLGTWNLGASPAYRELADVVRLLVLDGRVALDTALPSERALAEALAVSRTTVTAAYGLLRDQGFLSGGQGSRSRTRIPRTTAAGTTVLRGPLPHGPQPGGPGLAAAGLAPGLAAPGLAAPPGLIDLAYSSLPASGELVHRAFAAALTELPALLPGFGYDAMGLLPLREAVAARYSAAGVPTTPDQVLVTSGAQHALNIVLRALAGRHDRVLVEHPSYPNALDAIRAAGCRAVPVAFAPPATAPRAAAPAGTSAAGFPGSQSTVGWDLQGLQAALTQQRPRLAYVVPDFHNPTGQLMPDVQRRQLVRAAAAAGTTLVVDETLRELNLDGAAATPVAAFSPAVVTIGTLSKSHWGGLRTGWIRASQDMIQRFAAARTSLDLGGPVMEQLAAAHLVRAMDEPLPARLDALRENRAALLELLAGHLPEWETLYPAGGLSAWCRLPGPISTALTVIAPDHGIRLAAGPRFGIGGAFEGYLRVPFTLPPEKLETAVLALRSAQDRLDSAPQLRRSLKNAPVVAIA